MKYKLSIFSLIIAMSLLCVGCSPQSIGASVGTDTEPYAVDTTRDMGEEYIDSLIFFGESTTYHIKSRGVLRDGKQTKQVWAPKNGTVNLDTTINTLKIVYPETLEEITLADALKRKQPERIILTFGLNGATQKFKLGEEYFRSCYETLIDIIRENSNDTVIILQSCFPIAESMDMSNYSVDVNALSEYINVINGWTCSLARDRGLHYLNTCEVLCDSRGFLLPQYDVGDGHHLTAAAYITILEYIRTHGVE